MNLTQTLDEWRGLGRAGRIISCEQLEHWAKAASKVQEIIRLETALVAYDVHMAHLDHDMALAEELLRPLWEPYMEEIRKEKR